MTRHLQVELEKLKKSILLLGAMAEESVRNAIEAVQNRETSKAQEVIERDRKIDEMEVEIEEECLKTIALHQPVAVDLRFITAVIKINNDLERVGDEAVNIAQRLLTIAKRPSIISPINFTEMSEKVETMLKMSLDSLVNLDVDMAYRVGFMDDDVDRINNRNYDLVKKAFPEHPDRAGSLINFVLISRHLERIADHATNIAEEVIYMIEGTIHRHNKRALEPH